MDYDIINRVEMNRALNDVSPEYGKMSDADKEKVIDKICRSLGSKYTLNMMLPTVIKQAMKKARVQGV